MAKTKSNRRSGGAKRGGNWSNADHDARTAKRIQSLNKKHRRRHEQADDDVDSHPTEERPRPPPQTTTAPHHERPLHQIRSRKKSHVHRNNRQRLTSRVPEDTYKRSHLAHDDYDQIDSSKVRLATAQLQRKANALRERLESWDPVEEARVAARRHEEDKQSVEYRMKLEAQNRAEDRNARQIAQSEYNLQYAKHGVNSSTNRRKANLKKRPRKGPESWKLRGAARPAWEVYDFDTRFVDVHIKARDEANERARRVRNVLRECRGRFALDGDDDDDTNDEKGDGKKRMFSPPQPHCREYLSLLTRLGSLQLHRKNYSSARKSLTEAIDLEGHSWPTSITNARYRLMNMYLATNRPSSARKLWNKLDSDGSAWIRYSAALVEYVSWNLLQEEGSTARSAERLLTKAIRGNVYVAYLLGWPVMFERAMEYTNEVVERGLDSESGSVLEAIEYGCCCYGDAGNDDEGDRGMGVWMETDGSLDWVRSVVLRALNENNAEGVEDGDANGDDEGRLRKKDLLCWKTKLGKEEEDFEQERKEREEKLLENKLPDGRGEAYESDGEVEEEEEEPDVLMYAGMFRTAMDWLQDAGEFLKAPSFDYVNPPAAEEGAMEGNDENNNGDEKESLDKDIGEGSSSGEEEDGNNPRDDIGNDDDVDESSCSSGSDSTNDQ